jgi:hypothetical protein
MAIPVGYTHNSSFATLAGPLEDRSPGTFKDRLQHRRSQAERDFTRSRIAEASATSRHVAIAGCRFDKVVVHHLAIADLIGVRPPVPEELLFGPPPTGSFRSRPRRSIMNPILLSSVRAPLHPAQAQGHGYTPQLQLVQLSDVRWPGCMWAYPCHV